MSRDPDNEEYGDDGERIEAAYSSTEGVAEKQPLRPRPLTSTDDYDGEDSMPRRSRKGGEFVTKTLQGVVEYFDQDGEWPKLRAAIILSLVANSVAAILALVLGILLPSNIFPKVSAFPIVSEAPLSLTPDVQTSGNYNPNTWGWAVFVVGIIFDSLMLMPVIDDSIHSWFLQGRSYWTWLRNLVALPLIQFIVTTRAFDVLASDKSYQAGLIFAMCAFMANADFDGSNAVKTRKIKNKNKPEAQQVNIIAVLNMVVAYVLWLWVWIELFVYFGKFWEFWAGGVRFGILGTFFFQLLLMIHTTIVVRKTGWWTKPWVIYVGHTICWFLITLCAVFMPMASDFRQI
jgi:hypothetical protein